MEVLHRNRKVIQMIMPKMNRNVLKGHITITNRYIRHEKFTNYYFLRLNDARNSWLKPDDCLWLDPPCFK